VITTYEQASADPISLTFLLTEGGDLQGFALVSQYSGLILYCETEEGAPIDLTPEEREQAQRVVDERRAVDVY
jgi:hypothetical protein